MKFNISKIFILIFIIYITGCGKTTVLNLDQPKPGSNFDPASNKGLVIFDTEAYLIKNKSKKEIIPIQLHTYFYNVADNSERISSDGKTRYIYDLVNHSTEYPFYGLPDAYKIEGYIVDPGVYVLFMCEDEKDFASDINRCPAHQWKMNDELVGHIYFEVKPGEILNLGKISLAPKFSPNDSSYLDLQILENKDEAVRYMKNHYPKYTDIIISRPFQVTKYDARFNDPRYKKSLNKQGLPDSFYTTLPGFR
jgi:hypothetical protein